jgi:hypothetical protein
MQAMRGNDFNAGVGQFVAPLLIGRWQLTASVLTYHYGNSTTHVVHLPILRRSVVRLIVEVCGPTDGLQPVLYAVKVGGGGKFVSNPRDCHTDIGGVDGQLAAICQLPGECGYLVVGQSTPQQRQQRDLIGFGNAVRVACPNKLDHPGHQNTQTHLISQHRYKHFPVQFNSNLRTRGSPHSDSDPSARRRYVATPVSVGDHRVG